MTIRQLTPTEFVHYEAICQKVFFHEPRVNSRQKLQDPAAHASEDDLIWGAFNEAGNMCAGLVVIPLTLRMNTAASLANAIGGVVTLPEARGQRCIHQIMAAAFRHMREGGQVFSILYPFSFPYYRQFGYEMALADQRAEIPLERFFHYKYPARLESIDANADAAPFKLVYEKFTAQYNLAIVRTDENWAEMLDRDPYDDLAFTFLHRDEAGHPDAYVLYTVDKNEEEGDKLDIEELAWTTPAGLHAIFGFFGKLGAEFTHIIWSPPSDMLMQSLFPDPSEVDVEWEAAGMNRIINVCAALETLAAPAGSGWVTIAVTDAFLPENSGLYCVEWANGKLNVRSNTPSEAAVTAATALSPTVEAASAPDLITDIETLAQLVTGYLTPADAQYKKGIIVNSHTRLTALFPRKTLYMKERY